jgi:uncharacterized membrane protein
MSRALSPRALLWAGMTAFALGFSVLSVLQHAAFNTGRFDLGNMTQVVWSTANGDFLRMTSLEGEQISRLAAHVDPILALFAPLWLVWPSPDLLVTSQAVLVALGALPVFKLARKHLGSERAALLIALAYLLQPSVQWLVLTEFHPVALATPLLLWAFWFLDEGRLLPFAAVAVLACATKEEIPLAVAGMGLWYAFSRRQWRAGLLIALVGVVWAGVAVEVVIPHFSPVGESQFLGRYEEVGGSPGGILKTIFTDPIRVLEHAFDHQGARYLLELAIPLGILWALSPAAMLVSVPDLALNLLSDTPTQSSIHFHYTAGVIPGIVVAAIFGAARLRRLEIGRRVGPVALAGVLLVLAVASNWHLGAIPVWRDVWGGETLGAYDSRVTEHDRIAARVLRQVPGDAVVSATNSLGAHLSERRRILSFPRLLDATWIAVDETKLSTHDNLVALPAAKRLVELRADPRWKLVASEDGILLFRKASG